MKHFLVTATLVLSVLAVRGELYSFTAITANDTSGFAQLTGESQLLLEVSPMGSGQANLIFSNNGPEHSVLSQIYFDAVPELNLSVTAINNGSGVGFQLDPNKPKNLPAGQGLDVIFISDLTLSARNPQPANGISPYESLELILKYDDTYDLVGALANKDLRVGLHVQGYASGYSESFLNGENPQETVPEPGTISILFVGAFVLRWFRQR
jgi:hypothetical protein